MRRQSTVFLLLLVISWCSMCVIHESGHLIGGWISGGDLLAFDLAPWRLPYSIFSPDPRPLVTLWCGPLLGVVVPILVAVAVGKPQVWFVANFCVLANGVYIALAWYSGDAQLDTARLLRHGAHPSHIALYCVATIPYGYWAFRRSCQQILGSKPLLKE